jgi:hypothetical protein
MRSPVIAVALVFGMVGTTSAGDLQLSADAPLAGLPAVSKDKTWFARPVRVQPSGCSGVQSFVELGTIGGPRDDTRGTLFLVEDGCDGGGAAQVEKNLAAVNESLRGKGFASLGKLETVALPSDIDTAEGRVSVGAIGKNQCSVSIDGSAADKWTVKLDGPVTEVRGWYASKNAAGNGYIAVLIATAAKDTGERGRERWVDFWPVSSRTPKTGDTPVDVATRFMSALKKQDTTGVAATLSAPFWKVGLSPVGGKLAKKCKRKDKAKNEDQLEGIARCMIGAATVYKTLPDRDAIAEMDLRELPDELRRHKKKVAKLVKRGAKLVRYHVNDAGYYIFVIFVLDPDTDHQTASAILESVDVDE